MATYKVIQDIEAEDKLVGPLTLRQFIYGAIAALCAYLSFFALTKGFSLALIFLIPPMLFTGFFAFPFGRDQPTEVWALAKIRFYLKSRKRIWDQTGVKDLVTITVPKKLEQDFTNGLSAHDVQSRLSALASTLDTRGWAVKNMNTNLFASPLTQQPSSDRLLELTDMPQEVSPVDVTAADDIFENNNPRAHQLQEMVAASSVSHRRQLVGQLNKIRQAVGGKQPAPAAGQQPPADYWFLNKPLSLPKPAGGNTVFAEAQVVHAGEQETAAPSPAVAQNEAALDELLRSKHQSSQEVVAGQHLKTILPLNEQKPAPQPAAIPQPPVTPPANPATINLASNNDLNISTLARIANKQDEDGGEVVISLHRHDA